MGSKLDKQLQDEFSTGRGHADLRCKPLLGRQMTVLQREQEVLKHVHALQSFFASRQVFSVATDAVRVGVQRQNLCFSGGKVAAWGLPQVPGRVTQNFREVVSKFY